MRPHTPFKLTDSLENRLVSSLLSACVIAFCLNGTLPAEETETARQGDEWHMVHLQGKAAGYSLLRKLERENGELETVSFTRITMRRGTQKTTGEERLEIREDSAGRILGFRKEEKKVNA